MSDAMKQLLELKELVKEGAKEKQDLLEMFWIFLRRIETKAKPEDILDRRDVEDGYKLYNRIMKTNCKPRWQE